jgi:hypothetical protein
MHMEWNDMNAASTPYDPGLAGQAGRMPVSAKRRGRQWDAKRCAAARGRCGDVGGATEACLGRLLAYLPH